MPARRGRVTKATRRRAPASSRVLVDASRRFSRFLLTRSFARRGWERVLHLPRVRRSRGSLSLSPLSEKFVILLARLADHARCSESY